MDILAKGVWQAHSGESREEEGGNPFFGDRGQGGNEPIEFAKKKTWCMTMSQNNKNKCDNVIFLKGMIFLAHSRILDYVGTLLPFSMSPHCASGLRSL